jgi:hypothetical protein
LFREIFTKAKCQLYNKMDREQDRTKQASCPCHLTYRVGPFASATKFFNNEKHYKE